MACKSLGSDLVINKHHARNFYEPSWLFPYSLKDYWKSITYLYNPLLYYQLASIRFPNNGLVRDIQEIVDLSQDHE